MCVNPIRLRESDRLTEETNNARMALSRDRTSAEAVDIAILLLLGLNKRRYSTYPARYADFGGASTSS